MSAPTIPLKEKLTIYLGAFLLTLTIYLVIDLYVPIKHLVAGQRMSLPEVMTHLQFYKKAPFILLITFLMGRSTIRKRTLKRAAGTT
ncbi:hypothetical protein [Rufibacter psychrotolerans]|uniref:hypothetical protein n=1 Tax=Rufibacter psychrotolerans TaxID=2812556 RepID=UPI0019670D75|nr:hypothetical protein [Rufibacter sp. SYSU D00308]